MDLQSILDDVRLQSEISPHLRHCTTSVIKGRCVYYHYLCDGVDDRGWGCGYRTLQALCSFCVECRDRTHKREVDNIVVCTEKDEHDKEASMQGSRYSDVTTSNVVVSDIVTDTTNVIPDRIDISTTSVVPDIKTIQEILVKVGDKPSTSFVGSKDWIGTVEASVILDELYDIQCRILHASGGFDSIVRLVEQLHGHFEKSGSPVMIGGDKDAAAKMLIGVAYCKEFPARSFFLIVNPHYVGSDHISLVIQDGHVQWKKLEDIFDNESFYNFCLPLVTVPHMSY